jgi:uncharacterized protein YecE (DUF72 family)
MTAEVQIGTSDWKYNNPIEKGGWLGIFYPDDKTKFLKFYSQFFKTAKFDGVFYDKLFAND